VNTVMTMGFEERAENFFLLTDELVAAQEGFCSTALVNCQKSLGFLSVL
jgi:hypothetical protein